MSNKIHRSFTPIHRSNLEYALFNVHLCFSKGNEAGAKKPKAMKNNIQSLLDMVEHDNATYIHDHHSGSFRAYLEYAMEQNPEEIFWYLSPEECEAWHSLTEGEKEVKMNEIKELIAAQ